MKGVVILGSTGSIGVNALDVLTAFSDDFRLVGITGHSNREKLQEQVERHRPEWYWLEGGMDPVPGSRLLPDFDSVVRAFERPDVHIVLNAIVGSAGLRGTLAALEAGKAVALANKESLVVAGGPVMAAALRNKVPVLPVDSEHSAIFQALQGNDIADVERVVLTASGGPFRGYSREQLESVTVEQALKHPTWKMGRKITIDSATLMNKALEMIEARWLFDLGGDQIDMIVHPESIVHSFVEFRDASVMAQLSPPDMRLPIQYALHHPRRPAGPAKKLDWKEFSRLTFSQPDFDAFPAPLLARRVLADGGTCGAVLNAANEAAVERFLAGSIAFQDIALACQEALANHTFISSPTLDELLAADRRTRQETSRWISPRLPSRTI